MARLAVNVGPLRDPDTGQSVVLTAGSEPPEWADLGDHVFEVTDEPPRTGKGSGRDAWAAYAAGVGVDVDDEMSRDDIIAAVDDR